jgi:hypothetical protein
MRVVIGGVVGGLIIFFWGAVAHMATPLGHAGLSILPADDESAVAGALKGGVRQPGLYLIPGCDMGSMSAEQQKALEAKMKAGPVGLLLVNPNGVDQMMSPGQLLTELGSNIAAALLAAVVLSRVPGSYPSRVGVLVLAGLIGWVSLSVSYWNWYGFPTEFIAAEGVMETVGWLLAGLALAAIVKPRVAQPEPVAELAAVGS